jgi:hypothetical protein
LGEPPVSGAPTRPVGGDQLRAADAVTGRRSWPLPFSTRRAGGARAARARPRSCCGRQGGRRPPNCETPCPRNAYRTGRTCPKRVQ